MSNRGADLRKFVEKSRDGSNVDSMHEEFLERMKSEQYHNTLKKDDFDENEEPDDDDEDDQDDDACLGDGRKNISKVSDQDAMHREFLEKERLRAAAPYSQKPSENKMPNSLDMLEEGLMTAYDARKKAIAQRMQTTKNRIQRSKRNGMNSSSRQAAASRTYSDTMDEEEGDDENDDSLHISVPTTTARPAPTSSSANSAKNPSPRQTSTEKKASPEKKGTRPVSTAFSSLDDQMYDTEAAEIFAAFKKDLSYWWKTNPLKRTDEDIRGDLADDMTERYLCQRLDPLPASRVVTHIRKSVSQIIEDFATDGTLPPEILGGPEVVAPVTKYAQVKAATEAEKERLAAEAEANRKLQVEKNAADRAAAEKKRMKEQYEQYMALKRKTVNHEDNKKADEIETHLDDIRNLISSIKTGGGDAPTAAGGV